MLRTLVCIARAALAVSVLLAAIAASAEPPKDWPPIEVSGQSVAPGETARIFVDAARTIGGKSRMLDTLVVVTRGSQPGPTPCLTAGIHGDELNGVEIAHRIYASTPGATLAGTLIAVPAVNTHGVRNGSRYLDAGLPAVIYEAGEPLRFEEAEIAQGVEGVKKVMAGLGMIAHTVKRQPSEVYQKTAWVRSGDALGVFLTARKPGDRVKQGDVLRTVTDPVTEDSATIVAPRDGRIIEMAVLQIVLPGYGLFHLGFDPE